MKEQKSETFYINRINNKKYKRYNRTVFILLSCVFIFLTSSYLSADKIILKTNEIFKGKIIFQDQKKIKIKTSFTILILKKTDIRNVIYERPDETHEKVNVFTVNNKVFRGVLISQDKKVLKLKIKNRVYKINKSDIESVDWKKKLVLAKKSNSDLRVSSLWRSALLPGWGQFYQKRKTLGFVYCGLFWGSLTSTLIVHKIYKNAEADYFDVPIKSNFDKADKLRKVYNGLLISTIAVWVWQVVDSAVFTPKIKNNRVIISVVPDNYSKGCSVALSKFF